MDLAKSALTFTLGAIVTLGFLDRIEESRARKRYIAEATIQLRLAALDDYRRSSLRYLQSAHAAFTYLYQWTGTREKSESMRDYEEQAYPDFLAASEGLARGYGDLPELPALIENMDSTTNTLFKNYDQFVNRRLAKSERESVPVTDRSAWWDSVHAHRKEHDRLMKECKQLRDRILSLVEPAAYVPPPVGVAQGEERQ